MTFPSVRIEHICSGCGFVQEERVCDCGRGSDFRDMLVRLKGRTGLPAFPGRTGRLEDLL